MRKLAKLLLGAALACASARLALAQLPAELLSYLWSAEWITAADAPQRDEVVLHFRKVLDLAAAPQHFVVQVSADNQFVLYVNQQRVGLGPSRSDLAHWRYETYDIAPMLHAGKNVLAATVWNFGVHTPLAQISDRTAFVLHGESEAERIADTGPSWQVEVESGLRTMPDPEALSHEYYVAEPAEEIDGRIFDWNWSGPSDAGGEWKTAEAIGHASLLGGALQNDNWQLMPDPLPTMQMELVPAGKVVRATGMDVPSGFPESPFTIPAHAKVTLLLDNSHLTTGYPELTLSGGRGSTARLTYAEALVNEDGEKGNRNDIAGKDIVGVFDQFIADGADGRTYAPLGWKTWRYLQIDITTQDQPLRVDGLKTWFTAFPFEERGYFRSNDASLQPIWDIGWRTARLDAHDTYMDTPYYERMQYVGDTRIQALISYTVAGDDRLARQAMQAFGESRLPEGLTRSRYPSSVRQVIPTFSLLWVGMLHDFWMYRGDADFVRSELPGTRAVLDWFLRYQRPDGLLRKLPWWPFVDWGKDFPFGMPPQDADGGSAPITLQFVEALRYAAQMESAYGEPARAELYRQAAAKATDGVEKLCWNKKYGLLADTPAQSHFSQHANILGVWLDVIPRAEQKEVLNKILSTTDPVFTTREPVPPMTAATYYFRFYLARAVEHAGMGDRYLDLLGPWHKMVLLGLTTWAETPEPTRSDSHAWSAHPNYDFLTIVAGIRPKTPGFASVVMTPHLGTLRQVSAALPTPKGMIEAEYTTSAGGVEAQITLPEGGTGELQWKEKSLPLHAGEQKLILP